MSDSPRKLIRQAVVRLLSTPVEEIYPTAVNGNVLPNRVHHLSASRKPCLTVYSLGDKEHDNCFSTQVGRVMTLALHGHASDKVSPDDFLDDLMWQAENCVFNNQDLGFDPQGSVSVNDIRFADLAPLRDGDGLLVEGQLALTLDIEYVCSRPAATPSPVPFESIHGDLTGKDGAPAVEIQVELEQE